MTEPLRGHATPEGTGRFAAAAEGKGVSPRHFRKFQSLALSSLGEGTYLGEADAETDRLVEESVYRSVASGAVNVIDTAINYRMQKAERSVGRAVRRLTDEGAAERESFFICTKNGYLTSDGDLPLDFWSYVQRELIRPGKLKPDDIGGDVNAVTVPFLKDQFERSIRNLGLESIDLLYLHNAAESWLSEIGLRRFLERLEAVFSYYEEERRKGRLSFYGLATWTCFRVPRDDPGRLNLDDVVDVARNVGGNDHGFRFVQLPFNIAMTEALVLKNQRLMDEPLPVLEAAKRLDVGVFTSAPTSEGQLLNHPRLPPVENSKVLSLLQFARSAHPSVVAPLIGQKDPKHVEENLKLGSLPPLDEEGFRRDYGSFLGEADS